MTCVFVDQVFCCMLAACIHARHLMVWSVFAPKLIFEGIAFIITLPSMLIGFFLLQQITSRLDRLLQSLRRWLSHCPITLSYVAFCSFVLCWFYKLKGGGTFSYHRYGIHTIVFLLSGYDFFIIVWTRFSYDFPHLF